MHRACESALLHSIRPVHRDLDRSGKVRELGCNSDD